MTQNLIKRSRDMVVSLEFNTKCQIVDIVVKELSRVILRRNDPGNLEIIEPDWPDIAITLISTDGGNEITLCALSIRYELSSDIRYVNATLTGFVALEDGTEGRIEFEELDISTCQEALAKEVVLNYLDDLMHDVIERKMDELAKEHHDLGVLMNRKLLG